MAVPEPNPNPLQALERENERLRRSLQELSLLNELAREIGVAHDTDAVMRTIVRRSLKSVGAEQGVISLVEERSGDPMTTLIRTAGSNEQQTPFHLNDPLLGWMLYHKKPLRLDDPARDPRFRDAAWQPAVRSVLCVPLITRARLIGILAVFNKQPAGSFTEDDQRLLSIIAAQSAQLVENVRLREQELALRRMRREMRLAHEIQTSLLPSTPPEVAGYAFAGVSRPAQSVGGDFFDYLPLPDGRLGLCVADVSGKGLPAALLMATVQATLRGLAAVTPDAGEVLARTNALLRPRLRRGSFVTLFYGILDAETHRLSVANAGHNRPLRCTPAGQAEPIEHGGPALGLLPDARYTEAVLTLAPGETVLIFSDGVTEAMNATHEQFGDEQLARLLTTHADSAPAALIEHVTAAVHRHAGGAPPSDDLTLLCFRRSAG
ncbi:MAG: GAF domain-containing SpoIIE family protein phosphatase [Rhodothermales bacterium]|nr:GAF domain-containing SpoIIE family protein phosphatase [Rhodothermales bacterium]